MAVGFVVTENECWASSSSDPSRTGGFRSDDLQCHLLPFFTVGDLSVDPYDGAEYSEEELTALIQNMKSAILVASKEEEKWPLRDNQLERYYRVGKAYGLDLLPPRAEAIETFQRVLTLATLAYEQGESLVFVGD